MWPKSCQKSVQRKLCASDKPAEPRAAPEKKLELYLITAWLLATAAALEPNCSPNKEMSLFTKIIRKEIPSCKVGAGELWYAFLDINPRRAGHTLVVPVEEKQRLAELSAESRAALMEGVADAQRRLGKGFDTQDFTVVLHDGPLAGQEVPHVHVHVMPRTKGDGGRCAGMAAFPDAPPIGSVEPDFAALGALSEKLQAA